jgi:hypothetical protein
MHDALQTRRAILEQPSSFDQARMKRCHRGRRRMAIVHIVRLSVSCLSGTWLSFIRDASSYLGLVPSSTYSSCTSIVSYFSTLAMTGRKQTSLVRFRFLPLLQHALCERRVYATATAAAAIIAA